MGRGAFWKIIKKKLTATFVNDKIIYMSMIGI